MDTNQIQLVRSTWQSVSALDPDVVGELFYNRLFEIAPQVRPLFRSSMSMQYRKVLSILGFAVSKLDRMDDLLEEVTKLARRHVTYGVQAGHFSKVGEALLWTLEQGLQDQWTEEVRLAWTNCYQLIASAMIQGMNTQELSAA